MDTTFPTSLPKFQRVFPDGGACAKYLEAMRWPDGFTCPACALTGEPYRFATRSSVVLRCRACKKNTSLTAGTVMQSSHMPLSTWFWGAYLMTTQTPGQSAVQFQRQLDIATYETAFTMLHKLRAGMVRPDRDTIGAPHPVEVDECCIGGRTRGEGRGIHHQTTIVGAVEVRARKDAEDHSAKWRDAHEGGVPVKKLTYAGRLRLRVISSIEQTDIRVKAGNGRGASRRRKRIRDVEPARGPPISLTRRLPAAASFAAIVSNSHSSAACEAPRSAAGCS
jgi:Transposase zinc-ribbon domain